MFVGNHISAQTPRIPSVHLFPQAEIYDNASRYFKIQALFRLEQARKNMTEENKKGRRDSIAIAISIGTSDLKNTAF